MATTAGAYWAARSYFSQGTAFIFAWFMGFSFWEMTLSRFFMPVGLAPLFQCLCIGGLGFFLKSDRATSRWRYFIFTLGVASLGFYALSSWLVIWLSVALVLGMEAYFRDNKKKIFFHLFLVLTPLLVFPMIKVRFFETSGLEHFRESFSWDFWKSAVSYGVNLFWDGRSSFPFGSDWGGMLNPILTSLILIGFFYAARTLSAFQLACSMGSFILSLLPGLLTQNLELYRLNQSFPFFMFAATLGIQSLFPPLGRFPGDNPSHPVMLGFLRVGYL